MTTNTYHGHKVFSFSLSDYSAVRSEYKFSLFNAINYYLRSGKPVTSPKQEVKRAASLAFFKVADIAWVDGGSELPVDIEAMDWVSVRLNTELGYIDELFSRLSLLRKQDDNPIGYEQDEAENRAEGYAGTLDFVYSNVKLLATGNKMLTFVGIDGGESCRDCQRYKDQRHKASWWVSHDAIPGSVTGFECKGYRCLHVLVDDGGQIWTL